MSNVAFTAPHAQAAEIGSELLAQGASAVDAMVAAAAAISVLYPHMNSLGGDGFWLIDHPGRQPIAIDACGVAGARASRDWYTANGHSRIPSRGAQACVTQAGTVAGWDLARELDTAGNAPALPLSALLEPAQSLAQNGISVTHSLQLASEKVATEFAHAREYQRVFCPDARPLIQGETFKNPGLGLLFKTLSHEGLDSFYRGNLGYHMGAHFDAIDSPLTSQDFSRYRAQQVVPLEITTQKGTFYNLPAPTQGIASQLILAIYDQLVARYSVAQDDESTHTHLLIEATKQAFIVRDREAVDPSRLSPRWGDLLSASAIAELVDNVDLHSAMPWPHEALPGDTIWMGALDQYGCMVSFIQSIYWEFGSGEVIPEIGLVWNNRGTSFSLDSASNNRLHPGLKPFHTLNPALGKLKDGRRISYGTMGGEGQPQTQAAIISRFLYQGYPLDAAIQRGRWLLGRTWGDANSDLKIEEDLYASLGRTLEAKGHQLSRVHSCNELMGHAGAICHGAQTTQAASDPRSDGAGVVKETQ